MNEFYNNSSYLEDNLKNNSKNEFYNNSLIILSCYIKILFFWNSGRQWVHFLDIFS